MSKLLTRISARARTRPALRLLLGAMLSTGFASGLTACDGGDDSDADSGSDSASTMDTKPEAPSDLKVETKELQAYLSWTDNSDDEIHFMLARRMDGEEYGDAIYAYPDPNATSFIDDDVESGKTYFYRIEAMTADGTLSDWSNEATYTHP